MHTLPLARVRFGAFELDLSTGELRSTDTPGLNNRALLREQVFQVLQMLLEREGQIVTREEIKGRLWPDDTVVDFDHSINATVKALRRALGDSADSPRYIETLARRGYRLMPSVEYLGQAPGTGLEPGSASENEQNDQCAIEIRAARAQWFIKLHWWKAVLTGSLAVILVGAGFISWRHFRIITPSKSEKTMLAVLPFQNLTGDPNEEYLADGLTEETISQLGRLNPEQLGVIARTSVMGYKHQDVRLDQIGRDLAVQYVLESSLRGTKDKMRITAQLIQVKDQTHLWSQDYDYPAKDILNVEDDVAKAVVQEIRLRLTAQQQAAISQPPTVNPEAFDAYLQGYYYFQRNTDEQMGMAAKYFERATQLDPSYALAWAWLSRARNWQAVRGLVPAEEGHRLAREAVERALALNPNLAAAHEQMWRLQRYTDSEWVGADDSIQRAIALDPGNPDYLIPAAYSAATSGHMAEALALARRAVKLDPLDAISWAGLGALSYYAGQVDEAEADVKKARKLSPDTWFGHGLLSEIYVAQWRPQDALAENAQDRFEPTHLLHDAIAYYAFGRQKESDAALKELIDKHSPNEAIFIAEIYAFRNQRDEAFNWLDTAYARHDSSLVTTNVDPLMKNLHNDPRFDAFLKKIHLPKLPQ